MKNIILKISTICVSILICISLVGCTTTTTNSSKNQRLRANGKPWRKKMIRPENPYKKALWIPGDWRWEEEHEVFIWIPGKWFELEKEKNS